MDRGSSSRNEGELTDAMVFEHWIVLYDEDKSKLDMPTACQGLQTELEVLSHGKHPSLRVAGPLRIVYQGQMLLAEFSTGQA
jgi:hypothetical protein